MKFPLFQEKLHTIFHNNEGKNENTNEYMIDDYFNFSSTRKFKISIHLYFIQQ